MVRSIRKDSWIIESAFLGLAEANDAYLEDSTSSRDESYLEFQSCSPLPQGGNSSGS